MVLVVRLPAENPDLMTDEMSRVGGTATIVPAVRDPMPGHMILAGHLLEDKSLKGGLDRTARKTNTTRNATKIDSRLACAPSRERQENSGPKNRHAD
jgi:hypothetical protein